MNTTQKMAGKEVLKIVTVLEKRIATATRTHSHIRNMGIRQQIFSLPDDAYVALRPYEKGRKCLSLSGAPGRAEKCVGEFYTLRRGKKDNSSTTITPAAIAAIAAFVLFLYAERNARFKRAVFALLL